MDDRIVSVEDTEVTPANVAQLLKGAEGAEIELGVERVVDAQTAAAAAGGDNGATPPKVAVTTGAPAEAVADLEAPVATVSPGQDPGAVAVSDSKPEPHRALSNSPTVLGELGKRLSGLFMTETEVKV